MPVRPGGCTIGPGGIVPGGGCRRRLCPVCGAHRVKGGSRGRRGGGVDRFRRAVRTRAFLTGPAHLSLSLPSPPLRGGCGGGGSRRRWRRRWRWVLWQWRARRRRCLPLVCRLGARCQPLYAPLGVSHCLVQVWRDSVLPVRVHLEELLEFTCVLLRNHL